MMKIRWIGVLTALVLLAAACGDDAETESGDGPNTGGGNEDAGGGTDGTGDGEDPGDNGSSGDGDDPDDPDNDDFGDLIGDPEFDADALPDGIEDMIDTIDNAVSIGDCVAVTIGIGLVPPEGWMCRVLDNPVPGFDGFTLLTEDTELEITVGSPSPIQTCDFEGICDNVTAVAIPGFSDAIMFDVAGLVGGIAGSHDVFEADLVVTHDMLLTEEDIQFVADVMETLTEV